MSTDQLLSSYDIPKGVHLGDGSTLVDDVLAFGGNVVVEARTGMGKSYAFLAALRRLGVPFVFATDGGARAALVWTDNRTVSGTTGVNGDIYTNVVEVP